MCAHSCCDGLSQTIQHKTDNYQSSDAANGRGRKKLRRNWLAVSPRKTVKLSIKRWFWNVWNIWHLQLTNGGQSPSFSCTSKRNTHFCSVLTNCIVQSEQCISEFMPDEVQNTDVQQTQCSQSWSPLSDPTNSVKALSQYKLQDALQRPNVNADAFAISTACCDLDLSPPESN